MKDTFLNRIAAPVVIGITLLVGSSMQANAQQDQGRQVE
jgi:hypothetical protein